MAGTPDELIGTPDAPWRVWAADQGAHPVRVLLRVQTLYLDQRQGAAVPSHPTGMPLRLRHIDEHTDALRPLIVEAVRQLTGAAVPPTRKPATDRPNCPDTAERPTPRYQASEGRPPEKVLP